MRRWNGWGDESVRIGLPPKAHELLREKIGPGWIQPDYPLDRLLARIPDSRLPRHPLISVDAKCRLDHAHGQSLTDWVDLHGGTLEPVPDGVAQPSSSDDVAETLRFAEEQDAIVIPFGGGTSVVGHLSPPRTDRPVLSLSLERLNRPLDMEPDNRLATFEAGIRGPDLERGLQSQGFTLGHYPQSFEYSSLGGWVATRSVGQQSAHFGRMDQLFRGGELVTPRGTLDLTPFPASAAGPDLRHLILGSEGRVGVLTKVIVQISRLPEKDDVYGFFFPSWEQAQLAVQDLAGSGIPFSMVRLSNGEETRIHQALAERERDVALLNRYLRLRGIPEQGSCLCLIGITGPWSRVRTARHETFTIFRGHRGVSVGKAVGNAWKKYRFRSAYLRNTLWETGYAVDTLETAVTWNKVTQTLEAIEECLRSGLAPWDERVHVFSHLSSVYPSGSSIYTTFVFRLGESPRATLERWRKLKGAASRAIVKSGATISHQHGVGRDHREYLEAEKGAFGISTIQQVLSHLDPGQRMNPGKLLPERHENEA